MTANDVAADQRNVAGLQVVWDAVFLAHYDQVIGRDCLHLEAVMAQVIGVCLAAAALRVLVEGDLSSIGGGFGVER